MKLQFNGLVSMLLCVAQDNEFLHMFPGYAFDHWDD